MIQFQDKSLINRETLFDEIYAENTRQLKKWGVQTHSLFEWCNYLTEELGELAKAIAENEYRKGMKEDIYNEAIQVSTLALKIAEMVMVSRAKKKYEEVYELVSNGLV